MTKVNIDSFIKLGTSHTLFEDAVIVGDSPFPYLIVSDGCSLSKDTHLGSHLLARSAELEIKKLGYFNEKFGYNVIQRASYMAEILGLKNGSLDATLIIAYLKDDNIYIKMYGDGAIYYKENEIETKISTEYFNNMPYYLSYKLSENRDFIYHNKMDKEISLPKKTKKSNINGVISTIECDYKTPISLVLNIKDLKYLILSTDGIDSFTMDEKIQNEIDKKMHDFKNFNGEFLQRRLKKIIKENLNNGLENSDDLGLASFSFENGE